MNVYAFKFKVEQLPQKEFQDNYHKPIGPCEYVAHIQRSPLDQVSSIGLLLLKSLRNYIDSELQEMLLRVATRSILCYQARIHGLGGVV